MRIRTFGKFIEMEAMRDHALNDSTVVIDGQNFFYRLYEKSGLQYAFGCESEKYAQFLRTYLTMFKKAKVKCYIFFKGGHEDSADYFPSHWKIKPNFIHNDYHDNNEIVLPIFMKEIYKQILDEMEFNYVICEYEAKQECIAFAQKHKCPIISYDIEFAMSGVRYIPYSSLHFDEKSSQLQCMMFHLNDFFLKFQLTKEKLALFIVLTNERTFTEGNFDNLFQSLRMPKGPYRRNKALLKWLSKTTRAVALEKINRFNWADQGKVLEEEARLREFIQRKESPRVPSEYFENGNALEILEKDSKWFEKGVALQHIALQYVNLYQTGIVFGSWAIGDNEADDAMLFSINIIKYAFDLLTNFKNPNLRYLSKDNIVTASVVSIQKPIYEASDSVFENGWKEIRTLKLFEHFLIKTLQGFRFENLQKLPEDARLLMIALIYFSRNKSADTTKEVYSVLLSYVALSIVSEGIGNDNKLKPNLSVKPILDSTTDKSFVNEGDKVTAAAIFDEYLSEVGNEEAKRIFDAKLIHPLVEFQHCLQHFNFLNQLCGCPYAPTVYSQVYNGTCVYRVLRDIHTAHAGDGRGFVKEKLNPAPTVLAFVNGLIETYEETLYA